MTSTPTLTFAHDLDAMIAGDPTVLDHIQAAMPTDELDELIAFAGLYARYAPLMPDLRRERLARAIDERDAKAAAWLIVHALIDADHSESYVDTELADTVGPLGALA